MSVCQQWIFCARLGATDQTGDNPFLGCFRKLCNNLQNVVAITYIFTLQQPTFQVCNFLHFYFTINSQLSSHDADGTHIIEYLNNLHLTIAEASDFSSKLYHIKDLRNEAAHGSESLDINKAKKAQDVSYFHDPEADRNLRMIREGRDCHRIIIELLKWFCNN